MKITILALKDGVWQVYPDQTVAFLGLLHRYIFMLVLFFLGAAGGMMNIWRLLNGKGMGAGYFSDHRENNALAPTKTGAEDRKD